VGEEAVDYLKALQDFDLRFPGFEHEVHGVEPKDGQYLIYCLDRSAEVDRKNRRATNQS
jgi:arginine decarboxylase